VSDMSQQKRHQVLFGATRDRTRYWRLKTLRA
jgi:hypothetical protein